MQNYNLLVPLAVNYLSNFAFIWQNEYTTIDLIKYWQLMVMPVWNFSNVNQKELFTTLCYLCDFIAWLEQKKMVAIGNATVESIK